MKKDAISTGLFIAIGFLCVAIVIAILIPVVRDVIDDADDNRPLIPAVSLVKPSGSGVDAAGHKLVDFLV
ncbi:hypothetical protein MKZ24_31350 [Paenibacillus sp. FSL R7-0297]|uniref:hypothetical protein n=1 Tax=unclassified Paenibacillus TaxID=185978 RepID=UPI0004F6EB96|nr:hypothetical protein [Paenibacillus sp. FSL R5-0912]AIQ39705.1 hypothetical protein R50912_06410 [Paenibacillus sp. FSL R5-0912]